MRLVFDTNVVVSALLWRGTPYRLLEAARQEPGIKLYSSPALLDELADVLARPFAGQRLALIGKTAHDVLADYSDVIELVEPDEVPRVVPTDPDDDQVIAAALAAGADCIVSGDGDLLEMAVFQDIPIIPAGEMLRRIEH
ncbi:MAG: putative toxin-antitoxin system toxin component, PIN family [Rhodanobacter sp.]|jgi:putative PIN family toxin of toxin-antitoxin system|nr:putative toxin-antitoxin system toxin component, PIN family [Rhodanobacter sp.]